MKFRTMKPFKLLAAFALCLYLLLSQSCRVYVQKDNGKHKGWFKNSNNPHNPGHGAGKSKKN